MSRRLLEYEGFEEVTRNGRFDKGADIVAVRAGERTAVQVKRWNNLVDLGAVRQLVDGMKRYDCARGLLVTNSFLTEPAVECAETWGVEVWDRRKLAEYLDGDEPAVDTGVCADCGCAVPPKRHRVVPEPLRTVRGLRVLPEASVARSP